MVPSRAGGYSVMMWLIVKMLKRAHGSINIAPSARSGAALKRENAEQAARGPMSLKAAANSH